MELEVKSLNREEWKTLGHRTINTLYVENSVFKGNVSLMTFIDIDTPFIVNTDLVIADKGYSWLHVAPIGENWWATIMINREGYIFESYFDITKENIFSSDNNPRFVDMKLDVVVHGRNNPILLDEDEFLCALEEKLITKEEYDKGYLTAKNIISWYNQNKELYYSWVKEFYLKLK